MHTIAKLKSGDYRVVMSVSGGKDSTAMALHLKELGIPYEAVHMDTGWENADTYDYLDNHLPGIIGPITILRPHVELTPELEAIAETFEAEMGRGYSAMIRLVLKKGMFPSRVRRFCTQELKVFPIKARIDLLERLEAVVGDLAEARAEAKGGTLEAKGHSRPSWFQQRLPKRIEIDCTECNDDGTCDKCEGTGKTTKRDGSPMPIREVVEWSRTKRGGVQYEMFAAAGRDAGCVRWGLCDLPIESATGEP